MLKEKIYLIVGIGTDIGKTFLVENLCRNFPGAMVIKPIVSGFKDDDENSDSIRLLNSTKQIPKQVQDDDEGKIYQKICHPELVLGSILNSISPWRFTEAVSPHFAAKNSGTEINFFDVKNFCQEKISLAKSNNQFLFIEAAGGVMTPINDKKTFLDFTLSDDGIPKQQKISQTLINILHV
jgi:dethiobiotin synthetase